MPGFTQKGKAALLGYAFNGVTLPTFFYFALCRSDVAPGPDIDTLGELTQISGATGYTTNGMQLSPNATDFPNIAEVDASDWSFLNIRTMIWTASGGNLDSGSGARYGILTDDNATPANREILGYYDFTSDQNVSDTQTLTLTLPIIRLAEA